MASGYSGAEAFSQPKTRPIYGLRNWENYWYPMAENMRRFTSRGQNKLYQQFKDDYLGYSEEARKNAGIYQDYAKNLFENQPDQFANYKQVGDYLYGKFDEFKDASATAGIKSMNSQLALRGIAPGSSSYDRLLNATRITSNLAPAFANTTNAIGRDYNSVSGNDFRETSLRLKMAQDDVLNGYMDKVIERPLNVSDIRTQQLYDQMGLYKGLIDGFNSNIQGWQTTEGNDIARYGRVFDNWMNTYYGPGSYGSGGGGPGSTTNVNNTSMNGQNQPMNYNTMNGNNYNPYLNQINAPYGNTGGYDWNAGNTGYTGDVNAGSY